MLPTLFDNDFMEHNEFSNQLLDPIERATLESNYIQQSINSFKSIRNRNYTKAQEGYKECLSIADQLKDDFKRKDSLCNIAVSLFYCGNIKDSIEYLESVHRSFASIRNNHQDIRITILSLKVICNLTIAYLSFNKPNDALIIAKNIIEIISKEHQIQGQFTLIKSVLYNFFRVESIINLDITYNNNKVDVEENMINSQEAHKKVIKRIINSFHSYLQHNDVSIWINCLNEEIDNLKLLKDYNGLIFAIFNQQSGIYNKNQPMSKSSSATQQEQANIQNAKNKISALIKALTEDKDFDDKNVEKILKCIKDKMDVAVKIYQMLFSKEKEIVNKIHSTSALISNNKDNNNNKEASAVIVKHLLKYSLNYINVNIHDESLKNQMKNQIIITLKLIEKKEIDLSNLRLNIINPQIAKSLYLLFENLLDIYDKSKKRHYFKRYRNFNISKTQEQIKKRLRTFNENQYKALADGDTLTKINLTSAGKKDHFYRLDTYTDSLQIYNKQSSSSRNNSIIIDQIYKIVYGITSSNLKRKLENSDHAWRFISIIMNNKKSLDLFFNPNQIDKWFYGLQFYLQQTDRRYKILSTKGYVIEKSRMKMLYKMAVQSEKNMISDIQLKFTIKNFLEGSSHTKISFVKVLLLYNKCNSLK